MNTTTQAGGIDLIAAERRRQVEREGWTTAHDDTHEAGELAQAAAVYSWPDPRPLVVKQAWPWDRSWFKLTVPETGDGWAGSDDADRRADMPGRAPVDPALHAAAVRRARIRDLVKAGALLAAEIDRLQRLDSE